jgi:hypothetical protein
VPINDGPSPAPIAADATSPRSPRNWSGRIHAPAPPPAPPAPATLAPAADAARGARRPAAGGGARMDAALDPDGASDGSHSSGRARGDPAGSAYAGRDRAGTSGGGRGGAGRTGQPDPARSDSASRARADSASRDLPRSGSMTRGQRDVISPGRPDPSPGPARPDASGSARTGSASRFRGDSAGRAQSYVTSPGRSESFDQAGGRQGDGGGGPRAGPNRAAQTLAGALDAVSRVGRAGPGAGGYSEVPQWDAGGGVGGLHR